MKHLMVKVIGHHEIVEVIDNGDGTYTCQELNEKLNGKKFAEVELMFPNMNDANLHLYETAALQGLCANPEAWHIIADSPDVIVGMAKSIAARAYYGNCKDWVEK